MVALLSAIKMSETILAYTRLVLVALSSAGENDNAKLLHNYYLLKSKETVWCEATSRQNMQVERMLLALKRQDKKKQLKFCISSKY